MKTCTSCQRTLPFHDFYQYKKGYSSRCKECICRDRREAYHKQNPEIFQNNKCQWMKRQGKRAAIYWTGNMLSLLKRHFPNTRNAELVELIGVSERSIARKAKQLGLEKSKSFISRVATENSILSLTSKQRN